MHFGLEVCAGQYAAKTTHNWHWGRFKYNWINQYQTTIALKYYFKILSTFFMFIDKTLYILCFRLQYPKCTCFFFLFFISPSCEWMIVRIKYQWLQYCNTRTTALLYGTMCRKSLFITIKIETKHFVTTIKDDQNTPTNLCKNPKKIIYE